VAIHVEEAHEKGNADKSKMLDSSNNLQSQGIRCLHTDSPGSNTVICIADEQMSHSQDLCSSNSIANKPFPSSHTHLLHGPHWGKVA
jgi:hypothetical protein